MPWTTADQRFIEAGYTPSLPFLIICCVHLGANPSHAQPSALASRPGQRLFSDAVVANVSVAGDFVSALMDNSVAVVHLSARELDIPLDAWSFLSTSLPIVLTRNVTIEGDRSDWPSLYLNSANGVIRMAGGVVLTIRYVFLAGAISANPTPDQGFAFLAVTPPGPLAALLLGPAAFTQPACFPAYAAEAFVNGLSRPPELPGTQKGYLEEHQDGCVNSTAVPPLQRCWPAVAFISDMAAYGIHSDPNNFGAPGNFLVWMRNATVVCEESVDVGCLAVQEPLVCYLQALKRRSGPIRPTETGGGGQMPAQSTAPDTAALPLQQQRRSSAMAPPAVAGGSPGQAADGIGRGGASEQLRGSGATGGGNVAVIAGTVCAGSIVLLVLAVAAFIRVRRRRQQRAELDGGGAASGCDATKGAPANPGLARGDGVNSQCEPSSLAHISILPRKGSLAAYGEAQGSGGAEAGTGVGSPAAVPVPLFVSVSLVGAAPDSGGVVTPGCVPRPSVALHVKLVSRYGHDLDSPAEGGKPMGAGPHDDDDKKEKEEKEKEEGEGKELKGCARVLHLQSGDRASSGLQQAGIKACPAAGSGCSPRGGGPSTAAGSPIDCSLAGACPSAGNPSSAGGCSGGGGGGSGPPVVELLPVLLGKGTFGRVFQGIYHGERVAVKLPVSEPMANVSICGEAVMKSFAQEVEVLSRCQHPNVVRLLAACVDGPRWCLVMELMETSLDRLTHYSPVLMPLPKVLHIAMSIASALAYLHPTIVHRDLKPANVLINNPTSDWPTVKLSDFGISKLRLTVIPTENPEAGTPPYMAPECFDLSNNRITHHTDMYSFGVLLWEMLTGRKPWQELSLMEIAIMVALQNKRLSLTVLRSPPRRCPRKLIALIHSCWETDPKRRPAAAEASKLLALILQQLQQE